MALVSFGACISTKAPRLAPVLARSGAPSGLCGPTARFPWRCRLPRTACRAGPSETRVSTPVDSSTDKPRAEEEPGVMVVVGGGIIGLSTMQELLKRGYRVANVAKSTDPRSTTSAVAAGFVFPYLLKPISQCEEWVKVTLDHCREPPRPELVSPMRAYALHIEHKVEGEPDWGTCGLNYRRMEEAELEEFNKKRDWVEVVDGFEIDTYCFNTGAYLDWLVEDIRSMGGTFYPKTMSSLAGVFSDPEGFGGPILGIVNCTGVYARNVVGDEDVRPIYGQVVALKPQEGVDTAYVVEDGAEIIGGSAYMFPRPDKIVCGGTAILDKWSEEPDDDLTTGIIERVSRLAPELEISRGMITEQRCGLRPSRPELRLEAEFDQELGVPVVHSYGHGGSGWTVFKGASRDAADLVEQVCPIKKSES
mmetsp:Transcript_23633/g.65555  ORF Transcript_23633/g.65555 Transcript_23633/m.65555 type:complete len:420 (+) Transcript_23633:248-1507(+)